MREKKKLLGGSVGRNPTKRRKRRNRWVEALEETQRNEGKEETVGRKNRRTPNGMRKMKKPLGGSVGRHPTK